MVRETVLFVDRPAAPGSPARVLERREGLGGSALNVGVALAAFGERPRLVVAAASKDAAAVARELPEADLIVENVLATPHSTVAVAPDGTTQVYFSADVAPPFARLTPGAITAFFGFDLASDPDGLAEALHAARDARTRVALDAGAAAFHEGSLAALVGDVDVLFLNEAEARAITGMDARAAVGVLACPEVHVKLGPRGSIARRGGQILRGGPRPVHAVDTTGAGDAYMAAALAAGDAPLERVLERANRAGALASTVRGAGFGLRAALRPDT